MAFKMKGYSPFTEKKSAYKKEVPKIPTKSPHDLVQKLQAKKAAGTITADELKRLRELQEKFEGKGGYGDEQYDKE